MQPWPTRTCEPSMKNRPPKGRGAPSSRQRIVSWVATAGDARQIVIQIAKEHNDKHAVKSKSMATEEIGLNHALEAAGIETLETDLGEYIIQLAGTGPSHIIVPAVHQ